MMLSQHFSLEEMLASEVAARLGIDNTPDETTLANLRTTCVLMESIRALLGAPIIVTSGYRSTKLNAAIGGAMTSAHCLGYAVDFICPKVGTPLVVCEKLTEWKFDQLIYEYESWTHISFDPRMRQQILSIKRGGIYQPGIIGE